MGGVPSDRSLGRRDAEPLRENPNLHGPAPCRRRPRDAYPSGQLQWLRSRSWRAVGACATRLRKGCEAAAEPWHEP